MVGLRLKPHLRNSAPVHNVWIARRIANITASTPVLASLLVSAAHFAQDYRKSGEERLQRRQGTSLKKRIEHEGVCCRQDDASIGRVAPKMDLVTTWQSTPQAPPLLEVI